MSSNPIVRVEGLDVFYGKSQILFGVGLELHEGRTLALLGRNGAGKSTTMKAIAGVAPSKRGVPTGRKYTAANTAARSPKIFNSWRASGLSVRAVMPTPQAQQATRCVGLPAQAPSRQRTNSATQASSRR